MKKLWKYIRKIAIGFLLQNRTKNGYFAINLNSDAMGLGARIINVLEILLYCDAKDYIPLFQFNYREGKSDTDYFKELFYYKNALPDPHSEIRYTAIHDTGDLVWKNWDKKLKLNMANDLFDKYLGFNPSITDEVNAFVSQRFTDHQVLGIHYRGTDKTVEAPAVSYDGILQHIRKILTEDSKLNLIFISSDDNRFIQYLEAAELPVPLVYREDVIRSSDNDQFHLKRDNSKTIINHDAIVNCLILSRCNYLLKTASLLSDCSVIFNPGLRVSVVNAPYGHSTWWPTSEINEYALLNQHE